MNSFSPRTQLPHIFPANSMIVSHFLTLHDICTTFPKRSDPFGNILTSNYIITINFEELTMNICSVIVFKRRKTDDRLNLIRWQERSITFPSEKCVINKRNKLKVRRPLKLTVGVPLYVKCTSLKNKSVLVISESL